MDEDINLTYLETIHNLMELSKRNIDILDTLINRDNYSKLPVESWHTLLFGIRDNIELLQETVKILVEEDLKKEDTLIELKKNQS